MSFSTQAFERWCYANLDLVEEQKSKNKKSLILIAGASASGKSYSTEKLKEFLENNGYKAFTMSTDDYNRGISGIVTTKVNENFFDGKLSNVEVITEKVRDAIINSDFADKFSAVNLMKIKKECENLIKKEEINTFLNALTVEFARINFDEPMVYNLGKVAQDIDLLMRGKTILKKAHTKVTGEQIQTNEIISGSDYDIIIVEGIYALNEQLLEGIKTIEPIKNFIQGREKTLFLRRVLRDSKLTTLKNEFTIKNYFDFVYPSYKKLVLPTKKYADIVCYNNMTFEELRNGETLSKQIKVKASNKKLIELLLKNATSKETIYERDLYLENKEATANELDNILRLRTISEDEGKTYKLSSLVHKGGVKLRKDGMVIRPVNVLIKEGNFDTIYKSEQEFLNKLKENDFVVSKEIKKERIKLMIEGEKYVIDKINNQFYIEYEPENHSSVVTYILNNGTKCNSFYKEIEEEEILEK